MAKCGNPTRKIDVGWWEREVQTTFEFVKDDVCVYQLVNEVMVPHEVHLSLNLGQTIDASVFVVSG